MIFLYIIGAIVLLILVLGLLAPKGYNVFNYVKYIKNQDHWSPWKSRDPEMKQSFIGEDGTVGFVSKWKGNKEVGTGEQEIKGIVENERIDSELRFFKPWKTTSDAYLKVFDEGDGKTKVVWGFSGKNKFSMSIFMLFFNMDKSVGKDFEEGLVKLRTILEV